MLFILIAQTTHALSSGEGGITFEGCAFAVVVLLAVTGCVTLWWWQSVGGIFLISSAVISVLRPVTFALGWGSKDIPQMDIPQMLGDFMQGSGWWLGTLPILIAGALLLVSSSLGRLSNH
ncbi:hypothetical protein ACFLW0_07015 [Chloroflexota bacterium]